MKRFFLIILSVALVCGVVYLGIFIFGISNVQSIEIVGNVQQIYFVGDDINYGDAKLKVTYQNGSSKTIDMNGNVEVSNFSTSGHGKYFGTMKIIYKNEIAEVDYSVIDRTSYIISKETELKNGTTTNLLKSGKQIVDFKDNGIVRYFEIENGKYYMHDGAYDDRYSYQIVGDKILLKIGQNKQYEIKTKIDGNKISIVSKIVKYSDNDQDIVESIINAEFETTNLIKTNNFKEDKDEKLAIDKTKAKYLIDIYGVVNIPRGCLIDDSGLCIKVDYDNGEVYYVYITKKMIASTMSDNLGNQSFNAKGLYDQREFTIIYKFV